MNRGELALLSLPGLSQARFRKHSVTFDATLQPESHEKMSDRKTCSKPIPDDAMFAASLLRPTARSALPPPQHIISLFHHLPGEQVQYKQPIPPHGMSPLIAQKRANRPLSSRLISCRRP